MTMRLVASEEAQVVQVPGIVGGDLLTAEPHRYTSICARVLCFACQPSQTARVPTFLGTSTSPAALGEPERAPGGCGKAGSWELPLEPHF